MSFLFEKMTREECEAVRKADGFASGFEQGEVAGFARGEAVGFERGERQKASAIAMNLKKAGIDVEVIAANTGLTEEEVEEL